MKRNFQNYSTFAKVENPSAGGEIQRYAALSVNTNTACNKIKPEALTFPLLHRSCPDF
jgi:hypothetical protein